MAVKLMERLRQRFDLELPLAILFLHPTVESLAEAVDSGIKSASGPLFPLRQRGRGAPLFLVHAVGGGLLAYAELARAWAGDRPLYGLQQPGFDADPLEYETLEELAARYVKAVRAHQPLGPYLLGGCSLGGTIAMEMARQLEAVGERVAFLGLIDSSPPLEPMASAVRRMIDLANPWRQDLVELEVMAHGGAALDAVRRERVQRIVELNLKASRRYWPRDKVGAEHVVLFRAAESDAAYRRRMSLVRNSTIVRGLSGLLGSEPPTLAGWEAFSRFPVREVVLPGDHYSLLHKSHAGLLAEALARALGGVGVERSESARALEGWSR
jgi:thioesterase domain-containing protein